MADPIPGHRERVLLTRLRQKTESKLRTQEEDPPALLIRVSKIDDSSSPPRPAALLRSNRRMIALGSVSSTPVSRQSVRVTASPLPLVPPLVRALREVREILERARRTGDRREIEAAIERINFELDEGDCPR